MRVDTLVYILSIDGDGQWSTSARTAGTHIGATLNQNGGITGATFMQRSRGEGSCTGTSGRMSSARYHQGTRSITRTKIRSTTTPTIWSASRLESIERCISRLGREHLSTSGTWMRSELAQRSGTSPKTGVRGTRIMLEGVGRSERRLPSPASAAAPRSTHISRAARSSVARPARSGTADTALIKSGGF